MAPAQPAAKAEREKKLKALLSECISHASPPAQCSHLVAFASNLPRRFESGRDSSLANDLQVQIRALPLQASSTVTAKQDELDRLGTELWNLSTRLRRDEPATNGKTKEEPVQKNRCTCLLRVFSFLLVDSAATQAKGRQRKSCVRLMKVALKAARVCIDTGELSNATKVLERAAEYQDVLSTESDGSDDEGSELAQRLCLEYFAVRTALVCVISEPLVYEIS
jgi:hypothetical protein